MSKVCEDCKYSSKGIFLKGYVRCDTNGELCEEYFNWCKKRGEPVRHHCDYFEVRPNGKK